MKLTVDIELGREWMTMACHAEAALHMSMLRVLSPGAINLPLKDGAFGVIFDLEGNRIGEWKVGDPPTMIDASDVRQGDFIPTRPDSFVAAIVSTEDLIEVAETNGYRLTSEQAREIIARRAGRISDAILGDWETVLWDVCDSDIEEQGEEVSDAH